MKRLLLILPCCFLLMLPNAWAQWPSSPDPNRETAWNKITDTIHTIGQDPNQARMTKWRLHTQRRVKRIHDLNQARIRAWRNSQ